MCAGGCEPSADFTRLILFYTKKGQSGNINSDCPFLYNNIHFFEVSNS